MGLCLFYLLKSVFWNPSAKGGLGEVGWEVAAGLSFHATKIFALLLVVPALAFLAYCALYLTSIIAVNLTTNEDVNFGLSSPRLVTLLTLFSDSLCPPVPLVRPLHLSSPALSKAQRDGRSRESSPQAPSTPFSVDLPSSRQCLESRDCQKLCRLFPGCGLTRPLDCCPPPPSCSSLRCFFIRLREWQRCVKPFRAKTIEQRRVKHSAARPASPDGVSRPPPSINFCTLFRLPSSVNVCESASGDEQTRNEKGDLLFQERHNKNRHFPPPPRSFPPSLPPSFLCSFSFSWFSSFFFLVKTS